MSRRKGKAKRRPVEHPHWCHATWCTVPDGPYGGTHRSRIVEEPPTTVGVVVRSQLWAPVGEDAQGGPFVQVGVEGATRGPDGVSFDLDLGDVASVIDTWRSLAGIVRTASGIDRQIAEVRDELRQSMHWVIAQLRAPRGRS